MGKDTAQREVRRGPGTNKSKSESLAEVFGAQEQATANKIDTITHTLQKTEQGSEVCSNLIVSYTSHCVHISQAKS